MKEEKRKKDLFMYETKSWLNQAIADYRLSQFSNEMDITLLS